MTGSGCDVDRFRVELRAQTEELTLDLERPPCAHDVISARDRRCSDVCPFARYDPTPGRMCRQCPVCCGCMKEES